MFTMSVQVGCTFLYFAYGSNLLRERLLLKNPTARFVNIARLDDYRLTFDFPFDPAGTRWEGSAATMRRRKGEWIWGTVWKLDIADSESLDRQEFGYVRREVSVTARDGKVYLCRTYEMDGEYDVFDRPSPQYKDIIVRGAKQSALPQEYIEQLTRIKDNGFQGEVPLYNAIIKDLHHQQT